MTLRVTTFNVENLFNRYALLDQPWENRDYEKVVMALDLASIASRDGDLVSYQTTTIQRNNTAQAILDSEPDVLVVNEIENIYTLRNFNHEYLDDYFDRIISIDGNDPRGIDVGFLVREGVKGEIVAIRSHVDESDNGKAVLRRSQKNFGYLATNALFSRDCLEVDFKIGGKTLTFLANHLKAQDKKPASVARRTQQADRVAALVTKAAGEGKLPVVLGDLNVDPKVDASLQSLLTHPELQDPFPADTWTHYYASEKSVSRLDYILPHKTLKLVGGPLIWRNGLTTKCKKYVGPRYATIGPEHTEASDHCPVTVTLDV